MSKVSVRTQARQQIAAKRREQREADRAREAEIDDQLVVLAAVLLQREELRRQGGETLLKLKDLGVSPQVAAEQVPGALSAREAARWMAAAQSATSEPETGERADSASDHDANGPESGADRSHDTLGEVGPAPAQDQP